MPYLPEFESIFIHIPKNAGRSIEASLLPSGIDPDSGSRGLVNRAARFILNASGNKIPPRYLMGTLDVVLASQHLTLAEIRLLNLLPLKVLDSSFKFSVVRNPYDRALSSIFHFNPYLPRSVQAVEEALHEWIYMDCRDHNVLAHRRRQIEFVRDIDGSISMDFLLRFERINEDFEVLCEKIGARAKLPHIGRTERFKYRALYSDCSRSMVRDAFYEDIEAFSYDF